MKISVINGPNINMLGIREPDLYGKADYAALVGSIERAAADLGVEVTFFQSNSEGDIVTEIHFQSNSEGDIVTEIQRAYGTADAIVLNAAAYTHTSVAILDALKAVGLPTVEVHLTDINSREEFRRRSFVSLYAEKIICGKGFAGYSEALVYLAEKYGK